MMMCSLGRGQHYVQTKILAFSFGSECVCVLGGVKENNKQNKKFKAGWPFSVA